MGLWHTDTPETINMAYGFPTRVYHVKIQFKAVCLHEYKQT